jgi:hypothetical protein
MKAKLTEEAKKVIAEAGPALVTTSSRNGKSQVSVRGSFHILDDYTVVFYDIDSPRTINNIREYPQLSALIFDPENARNCRIGGKAKMLNRGDELFDSVMAKLDKELGKGKALRQLIYVKLGEVEVF